MVEDGWGVTARIYFSIALSLTFGCLSASWERLSAQDRSASISYSSRRMADGKQWMTQNLNVKTVPAYCYEDAETNCRQYGRLYTWESARQGCQSLGDGWRLPTNDEWRQMAEQYGGVREDSDDAGKAAYKALPIGGVRDSRHCSAAAAPAMARSKERFPSGASGMIGEASLYTG